MARVTPPTPPRRPPGPMPPKMSKRPAAPATLGEPRNLKDRPHGWRLALRRNRRRIRPVLYGLCALGVIVSVASVMHQSSRSASLVGLRQRFGDVGAAFGLRVDQVIVRGRTSTPEPLLNAAIGAEKGDPLLGYSVAEARSRITMLASVQDVTVERRWPSTILVSLIERHPFAIWQNQGRFALIDRDGSVLRDQPVSNAPQLPLVVGRGAPEHAAALLDLLAAHPSIASHMVAAVRVGDRRWNLRVTSGADVMLPEDGQDRALDRLDGLEQSHQLLDRKLQVVDLRSDRQTVLRPDYAPPPPVPKPDAGGAAPDAAPTAAPAPLVPAFHSPRQPT